MLREASAGRHADIDRDGPVVGIGETADADARNDKRPTPSYVDVRDWDREIGRCSFHRSVDDLVEVDADASSRRACALGDLYRGAWRR